MVADAIATRVSRKMTQRIVSSSLQNITADAYGNARDWSIGTSPRMLYGKNFDRTKTKYL